MKYRREIDGLRAVAVLPVILFHAGLTFWSGGFVGVDVFFVISGYLITTILIDERERGTYSVLNFYARRARRILPALFLVLIVCIPFAWMWIAPYPLEDFGRSMAFAALFISNAHFLEHGGYFDLNADLRPLLHTWSLAVEEQYYLLFPLVLFCLRKFRKVKYVIGFTLLALASLAVAEWGWRNYPNQNFYFTPSRLWEMLAGSLCAAILYQRAQMKSEVLAGLGLAMILYSTVFFDAALPFPSLYTLVPVVGTCLIILFAERETVTARLLSIGPFVGIGLISYSAYLWHQPIFAFARIRYPEHLPDWVMMLLAALALGLAWASWRFIEQPFRGKTPLVLPTRRGVLSVSLAGIVAFAALGLWTKAKEGFPSRIDFEASAFLSRLHDQTSYHPTAKTICIGWGNNLCPAYVPDNPTRRIAILGDSHSRVILSAFKSVSEALDMTVLLGDENACPPLLGVKLPRGGGLARKCQASVDKFTRQAVEAEVDTVVLIARWSLYVSGDYDGIDPKYELVSDRSDAGFLTQSDHVAVFEEGLRKTYAYFADAGIRVMAVSQVPQQRLIPETLVQSAMLLGLEDEVARRRFEESFVTREDHDRLQATARGILREVASEYGMPVLTLDEGFAHGDRFAWLAGNDALYLDDDHVSDVGAQRLAPLVLEALSRPVE
ncbi:MAG: acyltransferase family protein [Roseovarius sp.]|uniref:acyltransferase family protein n=1 Tax=Roseobacteraceae TaxID=2854170 RepID=UPI0032EDEE3D